MKLKTLAKYKNLVENDTLIKWYAQSKHQLGYGTLYMRLRDKLVRDISFMQLNSVMAIHVRDSTK